MAIARRQRSSLWRSRARRALHPMCVLLVACALVPASLAETTAPSRHCFASEASEGCSLDPVMDAEGVLLPGFHAFFGAPTNRYGHAVLGDTPEWGRLTFVRQGSPEHGPYSQAEVTLPRSRVFEDIRPRMADLDGDGTPEIVVVESDMQRGAQLAVYAVEDDRLVKSTATPFIGQRNRWLAPIGIADLDGDGRTELAYIDRPHLAKRLRIWRFERGELSHVADMMGLTNHRIGQPFITGGVRDCGEGPELVTVDGNWQRVMVTRLTKTELRARPVGAFSGQKSVEAVLNCR